MSDADPGGAAGVVAGRLQALRRRIVDAGGDPAQVTVVAVTKGFGVQAVEAAQATGLADVGENYAQEMLGKLAQAPAGLRWHFIGGLQRNKIHLLAGHVSLWQSVDRLAVGQTLARVDPGAAVLVQVNVSGEPTKGGCDPVVAPALVTELQALGLHVRGLMAVGASGAPEGARAGFRQLAQLGRQLGLQELSMGMSNDLEVAVGEGATMLRIGRALFGPRPSPSEVPR